jgi:hypothetical protein
MSQPDPLVRDFILFCAERHGTEWPGLYDEMARVAAQRLFRGLGIPELKELGLSLALGSLDNTIRLVKEVLSHSDKA